MNVRIAQKTFVVSVALVLSMMICCGQAVAAGKLAATVIAERGSVSVERSGGTNFEALNTQDVLFLGDTIKTSTGGEVDILFLDGSQIKVDANSIVRIANSESKVRSESLFSAILGVVWAHLRPDTRVETPSAIVIVRGTEIALDIDDDGTGQLTVVNGDAIFANDQGSVDVIADQQSIARPGFAPTAPVAVDPTGLITWTADIIGLPIIYETPRLAALTTSLRSGPLALAVPLSATPATAAGWDGLGDARRTVGDATGALEAYANAVAIDGGDIDGHVGAALTTLSQGRFDDARASLAPVATAPAAIAVSGLIDLENGKVDVANVELSSAVAADPQNYSAYSLLALAQLQQGSLGDAEASARKGVAINAASANSQGTLSTVLFFEGKTKEAASTAKLASKLDPECPLALLASGRTAVAAGRYDVARSDYEKALAFAPGLWLLHQELGSVYQELGNARKAEEEFQLAVNLDPDSSNAFAGLGKADQDSGNYADAESAFKTAVNLAPNNASARYYYASFLVDRGNLDGALDQINAVTSSDTQFGLLYARLAEIYLYKQQLFTAQHYAVKAVKMLPGSAIAHYELGRVYLEQQHTYQAEQEFRIATVLDSKLAVARYALGLVQEKTESGLLTSFNSIFDSDLVGSPASANDLNDLETPGAAERVQAAIMDPTAVRAATRSYGNTELDGEIGNRESHDVAGSYLTDTDGGSGVAGINGETQFQHGVRADADDTLNTASLIVGRKTENSSIGYTILGDYQQESQGGDNGYVSTPYGYTGRSNSQDLRLVVGSSIPTGGNGTLMTLLQASDSLFGERDNVPETNPYYNVSHTDTDSLDVEIRWDDSFSQANQFSTGMSYGTRHRLSLIDENLEPLTPSFKVNLWAFDKPFQAYVRDIVGAGNRWSAVGQLNLVQEYPTGVIDTNLTTLIPNSTDRASKYTVLPYIIVSYKPDDSSLLRLRFQREAASVTDFSLLAPLDDFLLSYVDLPQADQAASGVVSTGTSTELEWDKTLRSGSFFSFGAFRQDLINPGSVSFPYRTAEVEGFQSSYQGAISKYITYFLLGKFSNQEDTSVPIRIAGIPNFTGISTLQYLNRAGYYCQVAEYYEGDYTSDSFGDPASGAFGITDFRLGRRFGLRSNVFLQVNNVFDKLYVLDYNAQMGTEVLLGVSRRY
jgi:tetratricopeptide (TPR) repeat protein